MNKKYKKVVDDLHSCYKNDYVFIRIPKTGSESINSALKRKWNHYSSIFCKNELGHEKWNKAFTFSIVRNPWSRLKSWYIYHLNLHQLYKKYGINGFNNWIHDGCPHHYSQQHQKLILPENPLIQKDWLCDENGEIIVDYVGKLETINDDYKKIVKKIGLKNSKLPHKNKSDVKRKKSLIFDEKSIEIINELLYDDFETFNYKREP